MLRIGSYRIIRVRFCVSYHRFPVNDESCSQRQCPRIITIVSGEINSELQVDFSQIFRQGMHQPEFCGNLVARIA